MRVSKGQLKGSRGRDEGFPRVFGCNSSALDAIRERQRKWICHTQRVDSPSRTVIEGRVEEGGWKTRRKLGGTLSWMMTEDFKKKPNTDRSSVIGRWNSPQALNQKENTGGSRGWGNPAMAPIQFRYGLCLPLQRRNKR